MMDFDLPTPCKIPCHFHDTDDEESDTQSSPTPTTKAFTQSPLAFPSHLSFPNEQIEHSSHCEFGQSFYDQIEDFLDAEGLYMEMPSPVFSENRLTPLISLKKKTLKTVPRSLLKLNHDSPPEEDSADEMPEEPLPSLIARRITSEKTGAKSKSKPVNLNVFKGFES